VIAYLPNRHQRNKIYSTGPTNSTYCSWDDGDYYETEITYINRDYPQKPDEIKTKWHTFSFYLNDLIDKPEEPVLPPEEPPPKKPKVILYVNVKLARAPPWPFLYNVSANTSLQKLNLSLH